MAGVVTRMIPFLGNRGSTPAIDMPDSHNTGDFGQFLVNAPHKFGITAEQLELRTDGHMDIDSVREGAILICPVKVHGDGIYLGDAHAMQGDGELAGSCVCRSGPEHGNIGSSEGVDTVGTVLSRAVKIQER
jgi:formamidase